MTAPDLPLLQRLLSVSPFYQHFGFEVVAIGERSDSVTLAMPFRPDLGRLPDSDQYHGGAITALADIAGAAPLILTYRAPIATIGLQVDFLRPALGPSLRAVATTRRLGRTVNLIDVDISDGADKLIAVARGRYATPPQAVAPSA